MFSSYLFNLYAEYILWNAGLDESKAGIKIARRNISLRYADDTTLRAQSEEELKSLLVRVKEESENAGLKLNMQKTKITECDPITSWQIEVGKVEAVTDFILSDSKITIDGECNHEIKRHLLLGKKTDNLDSSIKKQRPYFANKRPYSQSYGFSSSHVLVRAGP